MSNQKPVNQLRFSETINASRDRIWQALFDDQTFRQWSSIFAEGSYFAGDWNQGSEIRFFNDGDDGMLSEIAENRPHEFMSIRHVSFIVKGKVVDKTSDDVTSWAPAFENYTLKEIDGGTLLVVETDSFPEFNDFFNENWPKALKEVKRLAEG